MTAWSRDGNTSDGASVGGAMLRGVVVSLLLSACVTAQGEMPNPPSTDDVANSGERTEQRKLVKKYGISYREAFTDQRVRVGDAVRPAHNWFTQQPNEDFRRYVASDADAAAK